MVIRPHNNIYGAKSKATNKWKDTKVYKAEMSIPRWQSEAKGNNRFRNDI